MPSAIATYPAAGASLPGGRLKRSVIVVVVLIIGLLLGFAVRPHLIADAARTKLEAVIPAAFGDWKIDASVVPLAPAPDQLALLGEIYDETLSRTYVNSRGERVMLALAYGRNQSRRFQIHKPEVCYVGQGFALRLSRQSSLPLMGHAIPTMELIAVQGPRVEPITYWIRVGDELGRGWIEQNKIRARFALKGEIPDGLLFRMSNISRGDSAADFELHRRFAADLMATMKTSDVPAVLGDLNRLPAAK